MSAIIISIISIYSFIFLGFMAKKILKEEIDELKALGYTDVQIFEAVAITGYFNYINTLSNVFALGE